MYSCKQHSGMRYITQHDKIYVPILFWGFWLRNSLHNAMVRLNATVVGIIKSHQSFGDETTK